MADEFVQTRSVLTSDGRYSRRAALRVALGLMGASLLAACAPSAQAPAPAAPPTAAAAAPAQAAPTTAAKPTAAAAAAAPTPTAAPAQASKQPIKLRYALWDESFLPIVTGSFTDFTAKNPSITVEPEIVPFDDHFTKLQREFAGGNAADVFHLNAAWAAAFAFGKQLLPIEDRMAKAGLKRDDFIKESLDIYDHLDGKLYVVPFYLDSMGFAYNQDLLAKAKVPTPKELQAQGKWDWNALRDMAKELTTGDGPERVHGFLAQNDGQTGYFNFIFANDGDLWNADRTKTTLDAPPAMEALQFMADLILKDKTSPDPQALQTQAKLPRFYDQRLATFMAGSFNVINLRKNIKDFAWDVTLMPKGKKASWFHSCPGAWHLWQVAQCRRGLGAGQFHDQPRAGQEVGCRGCRCAGAEVANERVHGPATGQHPGFRRRDEWRESQPPERRDRQDWRADGRARPDRDRVAWQADWRDLCGTVDRRRSDEGARHRDEQGARRDQSVRAGRTSLIV